MMMTGIASSIHVELASPRMLTFYRPVFETSIESCTALVQKQFVVLLWRYTWSWGFAALPLLGATCSPRRSRASSQR